jgi:hypothetical protein
MKYCFKEFDYIINLDPIIDILNNNEDLNSTILKKLKKIFNNRCYNNTYILDITKIINRSYIDINNTICFLNIETKCFDIKEYDIVTNNIIQSINQDKIITNNEFFTAVVKNKNIYNELKIGDNITIIIDRLNFMVNKKKFTASGQIFIPYHKYNNDIFYKIEKLNKEETTILKNTILNKIIPLEKIVTKKKRYDYFNTLLYPRKNNKLANINKNNVFNLLDINTFGIVSNLNIFNTSDHLIYKDSTSNNNQNTNILGNVLNPIIESSFNVYSMYLNNYYNHLNLLNDLCDTFEDEKTFKNNQHVFKIYETNKFD